MCGDEKMILFRYNTPHIIGCFYRTLHCLTHFYHPLRYLLQTAHQRLHRLPVYDAFLFFTLLNHTTNIRIILPILFPNPLIDAFLLLLDKFCSLTRRHTDNYLCRRSDRGICLTHVNRCYVEIIIIVYGSQQCPRQYHGTGSPFVDINTRVTALPSFNTNLIPSVLSTWCRKTTERNTMKLQISSCRTCRNSVVIFRIEIDNLTSSDKIRRKIGSSRHTVFFIRRRHYLQRTMNDVFIFQHR